MPVLAGFVFAIVMSLALMFSAPSFSQAEADKLPVLVTSTAGDGRLRDVQVIRSNVDKDKWITEFPTDPGVLLANNPAVSDSGRFMIVPSQGRSHGLWLVSGKRAGLIDMAYLGWPSAIGATEQFLWPEDPVVGDGRPQVQFVVFDAATFNRAPLAGSLIDDVEWVRGSAISGDKRWLLALVQRASSRGKTEAVLLDLAGVAAPRVLASSSARIDLVGPVSFSPDGSVVTFVHDESNAKKNGDAKTTQVFYDVVAGSELARWPGAYSGAWWANQIWALRPGEKKETELIVAPSPSQVPAVAKSLRQNLGDVRFVSEAPNEVREWPKSQAISSLSVSQSVVTPGSSVTFEGVARARDLATHPVNATRAGWLQRREADGKWQNIRYEKSGRVTLPIEAAGEYRWCSRIDFVLRDECSAPVTVVLN